MITALQILIIEEIYKSQKKLYKRLINFLLYILLPYYKGNQKDIINKIHKEYYNNQLKDNNINYIHLVYFFMIGFIGDFPLSIKFLIN